jgi:hypothetical protein
MTCPNDCDIGFATALGLAAGLHYWKERPDFFLWVTVAAGFIAVSLLMPRTLAPLRRLWLKLGHLMSIVVSPIILALMYVLAIVVTGVLIRRFGKDLLSLKPSPKRRHIGSNKTRLAPSSNRSRTSSDRDRSGASSGVDGDFTL